MSWKLQVGPTNTTKNAAPPHNSPQNNVNLHKCRQHAEWLRQLCCPWTSRAQNHSIELQAHEKAESISPLDNLNKLPSLISKIISAKLIS